MMLGVTKELVKGCVASAKQQNVLFICPHIYGLFVDVHAFGPTDNTTCWHQAVGPSVRVRSVTGTCAVCTATKEMTIPGSAVLN